MFLNKYSAYLNRLIFNIFGKINLFEMYIFMLNKMKMKKKFKRI